MFSLERSQLYSICLFASLGGVRVCVYMFMCCNFWLGVHLCCVHVCISVDMCVCLRMCVCVHVYYEALFLSFCSSLVHVAIL